MKGILIYSKNYLEMFAPRCGGCGRPILDNYISALSRHWHPECFACRVCITINFSVMKGYSLYWNEIATKKWLNHKPIIWQTQKSQTTDYLPLVRVMKWLKCSIPHLYWRRKACIVKTNWTVKALVMDSFLKT
jgi:hypothetical protein